MSNTLVTRGLGSPSALITEGLGTDSVFPALLSGGGGFFAPTIAVPDTDVNIGGNPNLAETDWRFRTAAIPPLHEDWCSSLHARMLAQFQNKPNIRTLLCAYGDQLAALDRTLTDLAYYRWLPAAFGERLDHLGEFYGLEREGADDDRWRTRLTAARLMAGARGRYEQTLEVLRVLDDSLAPELIAVLPSYPAGVLFYMGVGAGDQFNGEWNARLIKRMAPTAVQAILVFWELNMTLFGLAEEDDIAGDGETMVESDDIEADGAIMIEAV